MNTSDTPIARFHCNLCGQDTKHQVAFVRIRKTSEEIFPDDWHEVSYTYETLECLGCEAVSFREVIAIPDIDFEPIVRTFPPRISRRQPQWAWRLPTDVRELLNEVYSALHTDSPRVAMMGTRALLDLLILKKVGDVGRFDQKLAALQEKGYISQRNRQLLEAALDAGSAAVHRAYKPSPHELNQVLDIIENLIQHDVLEKAADDLRKKTPPRTG